MKTILIAASVVGVAAAGVFMKLRKPATKHSGRLDEIENAAGTP